MHRVAGLAKRWLLGTHQGSVDEAHLPAYLNEFVFRFNRRSSRSRGLVFYRVLELAAGHDPVRFRDLLAGKKPRPAPATWGLGHPPTLERPAANRPWRTGDLQLQLPIPLRLSKYPRRTVMDASLDLTESPPNVTIAGCFCRVAASEAGLGRRDGVAAWLGGVLLLRARRVVPGEDTASGPSRTETLLAACRCPRAGVPGPSCRRPVRSSVASCSYSAVSSGGTHSATLSRATAADR